MRASWLGLVAALLGTAMPATAAELTRVASSGDPNNPFDLDFWIGFAYADEHAKITREAGACLPGLDCPTDSFAMRDELQYVRVRKEMPLRLAIGVYKDLEVHASTNIVFADDRSWRYATGVDASTSSITQNCLDKRWGNGVSPLGLLSSTCPDNPGNVPQASRELFPVGDAGKTTYRSGLDNFVLGVAWAPLSDQRDDTKPKFVIGFDYTLPSADPIDPWLSPDYTSDADKAAPNQRGPIGDKVHKFDVWLALSKRLGYVDPYFKIFAKLPRRAPKFYSNCDHRFDDDATGVPTADGNGGKSLSYPENCLDGPWDRVETGIKAPYMGGFLFGSEIYAYDDQDKHQRVSFDIQLGATYVSEGRYANELSDALRKQLYAQEYLQAGGRASLNARMAQYVALRLTFAYYYNTEHFLTAESIGLDRACSTAGVPAGCGNARVDLDNLGKEINPNFDFRYDLSGRRFRIQESRFMTLMATGIVNF